MNGASSSAPMPPPSLQQQSSEMGGDGAAAPGPAIAGSSDGAGNASADIPQSTAGPSRGTGGVDPMSAAVQPHDLFPTGNSGELDLNAVAARAAAQAADLSKIAAGNSFGANRGAQRKFGAPPSSTASRFAHANIYHRSRKSDGVQPFADPSQDSAGEDSNQFAGAKRKPSSGPPGARKSHKPHEHASASDDAYGRAEFGGLPDDGLQQAATAADDGRARMGRGASAGARNQRDESDQGMWSFDLQANTCSYNHADMIGGAQASMDAIQQQLDQMKKELIATYTDKINKFFDHLSEGVGNAYGQKWQAVLQKLKAAADEGAKLRQSIHIARTALYGAGGAGVSGGRAK